MTAYHGGKKAIGQEISNQIKNITEETGLTIKGYCEPFVGMAGVYQHIPELFKNINQDMDYKAGDINKSVIKMWQSSQKGWVPPVLNLSKTQWEKLKYDGKSSPEKGFLGHLFSYRGIYFGTYFDRPTLQTGLKNALNVMLIAQKLKQVKFTQGRYEQFSYLKNYVIYCDPPYANTRAGFFEETGKRMSKFNHEEFYNWCREMAKHNLIFVSEYSAPDDFNLVWQKDKEKLYLV